MAYIDTKYIGDCDTCKHYWDGLGCDTYCDNGGSYRPNMNKIPTADVVEVRHGEWEIVKGSNGKEKMACTDCRHQQDLHSTFTYCPNCGAKMDGRSDT